MAKLTDNMEEALEADDRMLSFVDKYEKTIKRVKENNKMEGQEKQVVLNGNAFSQEQFLQESQRLTSKKGVKLVEISPDVYATRLQG